MDELAQRLEIARAQSKRVQREARSLTQMIAGILDLQAEGHKENQDAGTHSSTEDE
jgi:hypothetical protein